MPIKRLVRRADQEALQRVTVILRDDGRRRSLLAWALEKAFKDGGK